MILELWGMHECEKRVYGKSHRKKGHMLGGRIIVNK